MSLPSIDPIAAATSPEQTDGNPFNYVPTGWVCILFIVLFSLTTMAHILQAFWLKVWYMFPTLAICGLVEIIGWTGRYWGHENPYNRNPFLMQPVLSVSAHQPRVLAQHALHSFRICTTIMAPSFMTAAMFLILPRIMWGALLLQAIGGGVASSATTLEGANRGGNIMLAGIVIQLAAVTLFDLLSIEFVVRYAFGRPARGASTDHEKHKIPKRVVLMLVGLGIASVFILVRSIYRTIELTDGWNGRIISTEKWFNWFDGGAIVMAMVTSNVFHPGFLIKGYGNKLLDFGQTPTNGSQEQKLPDEV
ncbi:hypothetical protein RSAG8_02630, partial [Rhizoctonia solani AG-8 WAC10335]